MRRYVSVPKNSFYSHEFKHDASRVGFVADIGGSKSPKTLQHISRTMINLTHGGTVDTDTKSRGRRVCSPDIPI